MKIILEVNGEELDLTSEPFRILKEIDFSGLSASFNTAELSSDGVKVLNSRFNQREFELEGMINLYKKDESFLQEQKNKLFLFCNPKNTLKLKITKNHETFYLNCFTVSFPVFSVESSDKTKTYQRFLIQFTAPDPYLYKDESIVQFSTVQGKFSFPMKFNKVTMGLHDETLTRAIHNNSMANSPLTITLLAKGNVKNPYLLNLTTQEKLQLNTTLVLNDFITIKTGREKSITKTNQGIETNFFYALDLNSNFLQLHSGDNVLRFGAADATSEANLKVEIRYQERRGAW